ncbi:hypothetical protein COTS27_01140 [Spirochaetota bacterium]|nr:hypothetical protein COTS27_01140 [Spirochaetota bacterium]
MNNNIENRNKHRHFIEHYKDSLDRHENKSIESIVKAYTSEPCTDIEKIIKKCLGGESPIKFDDLGKNFSGKIEKSGDQYIITVNSTHPKNRQRFTMAHEFAHYVLHSDKIGDDDGIIDDALYRSNKPLGFLVEVEANRFAGKILMPMEHINTLARKGFNFGKIADELQVSKLALKVRLGIANYDPSDDIIELSSKL